MKYVCTMLSLLFVSLTFGQSEKGTQKTTRQHLEISDIDVSVTVDSIEDIESTFELESIKELLEVSIDIETIAFQIVCNDTKSNLGTQRQLSYKVEGKYEDINTLIERVKKMKQAAINFYKNK